MASLVETRERFAAKQRYLGDIMDQAGPDLDLDLITSLEGDSHRKGAQIAQMHDELDEIGREVERLEGVDRIRRIAEKRAQDDTTIDKGIVFPGGGKSGAPMSAHGDLAKGLRTFLTQHKGYRSFRSGEGNAVQIELPVDLKTLITLTTVSPQTMRQDGVVNMALEERTIADLMGETAVDRATVEYYEETTVTNNAAIVAEGGTKPESALGYTLRTETIRKVAHNIPATRESLQDVSFLEGEIRSRLAFMLRRIEETQLLTGSGVGINLTGLLNRSGIQTQAKGTDPNFDAIYKAIQKIRGSAGAGFAEPTAIVMHPADLTLIKLTRGADGNYILGNPRDDIGDRMWGLPVRSTTAMTQGTALVGAFRPWSTVLRREGVVITLSTEHGTYFLENKVAILAESRLGLQVSRPSAFCTVTGIA